LLKDWISGQARNDVVGAGKTTLLIVSAWRRLLIDWIPGQARNDVVGAGMTAFNNARLRAIIIRLDSRLGFGFLRRSTAYIPVGVRGNDGKVRE